MIAQDHICNIEETFSNRFKVFLDGNRFSHYDFPVKQKHGGENDGRDHGEVGVSFGGTVD